MEWPAIDEETLPTTPLICDQGLFTIEVGDVELIDGKYILHEDEAMSLTCKTTALTIREIRPSAGVEYPQNEEGCVVFDGTALTGRGDRYGALDLGIYVPSLHYPIAVLRFELTAPLSVIGSVQLRGEGLQFQYFRARNVPPVGSKQYPYRFDYNITTDDRETDWHEMSLVIARPEDFSEIPSLSPAPGKIFAAYRQGSPVRIRLRSASGETYAFRAICSRKEIIRFSEPQLPVPIIDWIGFPNTLDIEHERYRFDTSNMEESWQRYPKLIFDHAEEWLEFQPIQFSASADMLLLEDGEFLKLKLKFDLKECKELLDTPTDFLHYLDPSINNEYFKFLDLNDLEINRESSEISFSFRYPLPTRRVKLQPRSTRLVSYYGVLNEGKNFYTENPFLDKNWNLAFFISFSHLPSSQPTQYELCEWNEIAVKGSEQNLQSRFHPRHAQLYRCVYERMQPADNVFCLECDTLGYTKPNGDFECTTYKCGWTNSTPTLTEIEVLSDCWYDYRGESSSGLHCYSLNKERLPRGKYVVSFNGMNYHFEVGESSCSEM
ncbi:MAG: hypothetical protein VXY31_02010 [Candidatus Thermoplasmatota archaeon]|nr:hypothetical protein [Candidatus Thermoplasmatota archaeon]